MAGSQKQYELLFQLKASLGGSFTSAFKNAIDTQKKLANSIKQVNSIQSKIDGYTKTNSAIDKNKAKLAELQSEHTRLQSELQKTAEKKKALQQAMETAEANGDIEEYKRLEQELSATEQEYDKLNGKLKTNENQIQQTSAKIEEQTGKLNSLEQELKAAGVNTDNLEKSNSRLQQSYDKLKASQERMQKLNEEQQKIKQSIGQTKTELLGTVGAITAVAAAVYAGPVKAAMGFETAMQKVSTIADAKEVPLSEMSSQIMQLSNETGIAAATIADDVYNAISAGQSTADAVNFVSNSTKLAKAGFAESSQTLDVLTTILNAYGMEAGKVGTVSDMLIQTQNKGKVTVAELSASMGKIIPTANANGVALEQLCAGYAIMTSKGIAAAETTTYMNSMFNELGKSGTTASDALKKATGQSFQELMASGKSVGEVLQVLQEQAASSGKSLSDMFGSAEAGKAAVSLLSNGVEGFNEQVQGMVDSVGATDEAFAKMENTTQARMEKAKNSLANLSIVLGQTFLPIIGAAADKVAALVTKITDFAQANPQLAKTLTAVVAALAGLKVAGLVGKLGFLEIRKGINSARIVLEAFRAKSIMAGIEGTGLAGKLKTAGSGILTYFGNVGKAIGDVGATLLKPFSGAAGKLGGAFSGVGGKMVSTLLKPFSAIGGKLGGILSGVGSVIVKSPLGSIGKIVSSGISGIGKIISPIGKLFTTALAPISKLGSTMLGPLAGIAGKILPVVGAITAVITAVQLLKAHLGEIREAVGKVFGEKGLEVFDKAVSAITNVGNTIKNIFSGGELDGIREKINETFGEKGTAVFDTFVKAAGNVKKAFSSFASGIQTYVVPIAEQVLQVFAKLVPVITGVFSKVIDIVKPIASSLLNVAKNVFPKVQSLIAGSLTAIQSILDVVLKAIDGDWSGAWEGIKNIASTAVEAIPGLLSGGWELLKSSISTVGAAIGPLLNSGWELLKSAATAAVDALPGLLAAGWELLKSAISAVGEAIGPLLDTGWELLKSAAVAAVEAIPGLLAAGWELLKSAISAVGEAIGPLLDAGWELLKSAAVAAVEAIPGLLAAGWELLKSAISAVGDGLGTLLDAGWEALKTAASTAVGALPGALSAGWEALKTGISAVGDGLGTLLDAGWEALKTAAGTAVDALPGAVSSGLETLKTTISGIGDGLGTLLDTGWEALKTAASTAVDGLSSAVGPGFETLKTTISAVGDGLGTLLDAGWEALKTAASSAADAVKSAWEGVKDFFGGIWDAITGGGDAEVSAPAIDTSALEGAEISIPLDTASIEAANTAIQALSESLASAQQSASAFGTSFSDAQTAATTAATAVQTAMQSVTQSFTDTTTGMATMSEGMTTAATGIQAVLQLLQTAFTTAASAIQTTVTTAATAVQTTTTMTTAAVNTLITTTLMLITSLITTSLANINSQFTSAGNAIRSSAQSTMQGVQTAFQTGMSTAQSVVSSGLASIRSMFANCHLQLPHIALPHFSVSGTLSLNPPQVPSISVAWYKAGGILSNPTIFGAMNGGLLGGGEAGKEAVLPLSELWSNMKQIFSNALQERDGALMAAFASAGGGTYDVFNTYNTTKAPEMEPPRFVESSTVRKNNANINVTNSPTVIVQGDKPDDLEGKLERNNQNLLRQIKEMLDGQEDDDRRSKYD